jgi:hypothetical protein
MLRILTVQRAAPVPDPNLAPRITLEVFSFEVQRVMRQRSEILHRNSTSSNATDAWMRERMRLQLKASSVLYNKRDDVFHGSHAGHDDGALHSQPYHQKDSTG